MDTVVRKVCLSDSFESQKKAAKAVANGLLTCEIKPGKKVVISQEEIRKAKARSKEFSKKYGIK